MNKGNNKITELRTISEQPENCENVMTLTFGTGIYKEMVG
jgi:hypothetical protein